LKRAAPASTGEARASVAARLSEAEALARMFYANHFSATTVADFGIARWHLAALAARLHDPDPETREIVLRVLRNWEAKSNSLSSNRHPSPAFDVWLADYCGRLERLAKTDASED